MPSTEWRPDPVAAARPGAAGARPSAEDRRLERYAQTAAAVVAVSVVAVALGWLFGVDRLRRVVPEQSGMRFTTSVAILVLALSWLVPARARLVVSACAAVLPAVVLVEYAANVRRGIDEWVVDDPSGGAHPGRMAVATALSLLLLALARVLVLVRRTAAAQVCALVVLALAALTLLGNAYDVPFLRTNRPLTTLSIHTCLALLVLAVAQLVATPGGSLAWTLRGSDGGAQLTRRLLPVALVGLPFLGGLALLAQRQHLWAGDATTVAITVVGGAFVVGVVGWSAARRISRTERRRAQVLAELTELKADLEQQVQQRAAQLQRRRDEIAVLEDRQRIAADLHDIVIQRLFAAGMYAQGGDADPEDTRRRLDAAVEAMDAAIRDLRAAIFELGGGRKMMPVDLTTAVDDVCLESSRVLGFMPDVVVDDPDGDAESVRDDLLAVLREALANVARHACASAARVEVRSAEGVVSLTVTDDGMGMGAVHRASGTRNMAERAQEHGGDCTWTDLEPHGTRVRWRAPVPTAVR